MAIMQFGDWAKFGRLSVMVGVAVALAGCEEGKEFNLFKPKDNGKPPIEAPVNSGSTKLVERDIEAPDAFHVKDKGLWDGRPSLGGVWVAHSNVKKPDRVIIRNKANGKFIIGALFRRERESPGPRFQVSSDAAGALGMLAGQPAQLDVVALHRKEVEKPTPAPEPEAKPEVKPEAPEAKPEAKPDPKPAAKPATGPTKTTLGAPEKIKETKLDPIASAAAAIEAADGKPAATARPTPNPSNPANPTKTDSKPLFLMSKPFVQVGQFKDEEAALNAAETLHLAGVEPKIQAITNGEEPIWRVVVGPAADRTERRATRKQIRDLGFTRLIFTAN